MGKEVEKRCITKYDLYMKMAEESEGFNVPSMSGMNVPLCGGIHPFKDIKSKDSEHMKRVINIAKFAVDDHNSKTGSDLVFDEVVKANGQPVGGYLFYLTIRVRRTSVKRPKLYQAKVWCQPSGELISMLFREKPPRPYVRRKKYKKKGAKPGLSSGHQKTKEKEVKPPFIPKGAFFSYLRDLRTLPQLPKMRYCDIISLASRAWRSMPAEEKDNYCQTRSLKYEDIAGFMSA